LPDQRDRLREGWNRQIDPSSRTWSGTAGGDCVRSKPVSPTNHPATVVTLNLFQGPFRLSTDGLIGTMDPETSSG
jgi:hypothetical protein